MAFFKKILNDFVGDTLSDALTGETAKNIAKSVGKHAAIGSLEAAAKRATERTLNRTINKASAAVSRESVLDTPEPPAVPQFKTLSVMIAVNGQSYGPYERATLIEMVGNGSLTRDTYVFMQGMSEWKRAIEVAEVAELFASQTPAPPVPPVPWTGMPQAPDAPAPVETSDNSLSPRLNSLITSAVADGEISDLERQVLIRNAQEEGVAMDEFVMVLEARLFEQRRILSAQEEEKKNRAKSIEIQEKASLKQQVNQTASQKAHTKCPHCGAPLKQLATKCPECGYDYLASGASANKSAWEILADKLYAVDTNPKIKDDSVGIMQMYGFGAQNNTKSAVKATIISNFPVPISKSDIFDFFTNCAPLAKKKTYFNTNLPKTQPEMAMAFAYYDKAKQVLLKARIVLKDDPNLLSQIEEMAKQYKIKV